MRNSKFVPATIFSLTLAWSQSVSAHYLWLERDGAGATRAYYGEWADDIREKTGGLLDRFKNPRVVIGAGTEPLPVKRNANHLEFATAGAGDVRLLENSVAPRDDNEKGGKTRTVYYAKHGRMDTKGNLDFELVPAAANGNNFVLMFLGAPLAKTELTIVGPPKWEKKLTTDDHGRITLPTPWAGRYVIEVIHFEAKPGTMGNESFERTRHISTLSFVQSSGLRRQDNR